MDVEVKGTEIVAVELPDVIAVGVPSIGRPGSGTTVVAGVTGEEDVPSAFVAET